MFTCKDNFVFIANNSNEVKELINTGYVFKSDQSGNIYNIICTDKTI
jgi:hypothetical protein